MFKGFFTLFSSLRLTFVLLCAATVLVFLGTMAQVKLGLYNAQHQFFRSFVVYWGPQGANWKLPVFPGGYLIGGLLLINLVVAHLRYYRAGRKKLGIALIHTGIVLLLAGQFLTDSLQVESHMRLSEGQAKNFSEDGRENEVALIDKTDPQTDQVVAVSESALAGDPTIPLPSLPLTLHVKEYFVNATPAFSPATAPTNTTLEGIGRRMTFHRLPPVTRMDARNIPAALVEVKAGDSSLGAWWVSNWIGEESLRELVAREAGAQLQAVLGEPQSFSYKDRRYELTMRPIRYYKSFHLELLKFRHDKYPGTEIPMNFSSRVRILNPEREENREVLIYMNHPLRYAGETYYQSGYDENDPRVTILQVVRNPSWLTPYFACVLVTLGMAVQFLMRLFGFVGKWRAA